MQEKFCTNIFWNSLGYLNWCHFWKSIAKVFKSIFRPGDKVPRNPLWGAPPLKDNCYKKTGTANIAIIIFCVVLKNFLASSILYYMLTFFSPRRMAKGRKTRRFPIISRCKFTHCITITLANFHLKHFSNSFMPIIPLKF